MVRLFVLGLVASASGVFAASLTAVGVLSGGTNTATLHGLSSDGTTAVGMSSGANGQEAFRWRAQTGILGLGDLAGGGFASAALGVNGNGNVVVGQATPSISRGFIWNGTMAQVPGISGGTSTSDRAFAASQDGTVVVGWSNSLAFGIRATVWVNGGAGAVQPDLAGGTNFSHALGVSGNGSVTVGWSQSALGKEAAYWQNGVVNAIGDFAGGPVDAYANGASHNGSVIVGRAWDANSATAFRWTALTGIQPLGDSALGGTAFNSEAFDVTGDGTTIVGRGNFPDGSGAFVWTAQGGLQSLRARLVSQGVNMTNITLTDARAISDDGLVIAGNGIINGVITGYVAVLDAPPTTVSGTVLLNDTIGGPNGKLITFELWAGTTLIDTRTATLNSSGQFSVSWPQTGSYRMSAKGAPHLRQTTASNMNFNGNAVSGVTFNLTNGDVDASGEVDAADVDAIIAAFGNSGSEMPTDVDRTTEVDAADIDVVIANFGAVDL